MFFLSFLIVYARITSLRFRDATTIRNPRCRATCSCRLGRQIKKLPFMQACQAAFLLVGDFTSHASIPPVNRQDRAGHIGGGGGG